MKRGDSRDKAGQAQEYIDGTSVHFQETRSMYFQCQFCDSEDAYIPIVVLGRCQWQCFKGEAELKRLLSHQAIKHIQISLLFY